MKVNINHHNIIPRLLLIAVLMFALVQGSTAQYDNKFYFTDTAISPADSHQLFIRFSGATFINNKEFFNPYQPGYTLTGFFLRPMLEYYPGPNTKLTAGVHLLKYSGLGRYSQAIPVFSFHHRFSSGIEMVAGSLYGSVNHDLIEPLFSWERMFTNHNESGLQFLLNKDFFRADIWLNWERFIFAGDPFREEFTAGLSSTVFTGIKDSRLSVSLPLQLLIIHRGGQIDASGERMQNMVNYAAGIIIDRDIGHGFFESVSLRGYFAGFRDLSGELQYHYDDGWGIYPNVILQTRWVGAGLGYWKGYKFVAPRGEPVFQSVSRVNPDFFNDHRELLTSKVIFHRSIAGGINLGLRFEIYYDTADKFFDHSAWLNIMIDQRFFISRLQRR
jgi:hypothetical protein